MKFWENVVYMKEAGDEGDESGGGANTELDSLKAEKEKLANHNKKILDEQKALKDQLKKYEGIDPEQVKKVMKALEENEELKLITDGKHDEVIKRRTEKVATEYKSQIDNLTNETTNLKNSLTSANTQIQKLLIDNNAVGAFVKAGGLDTAIDDVILRANKEFKVEDGVPIKRDASGEIVRGKNGALTLEEWAEGLREKAPHFFPTSTSTTTKGNDKTKTQNTLEDKLMDARKAGNTKEVRRLKDLIAKEKEEKK